MLLKQGNFLQVISTWPAPIGNAEILYTGEGRMTINGAEICITYKKSLVEIPQKKIKKLFSADFFNK
jgi:hypothetical protein